MVLECLACQIAGIVAWHEVVHLLLVLIVYQYHLYLVLAISYAAIQCYAVQPLGYVGLWYAASYHPLEVHDEVERNSINVVGISQDPRLRSILLLY